MNKSEQPDGIGENAVEPITPKSVEEQANSPENASELLFARLSNPVIRKQIIDLLCESEAWSKQHSRHTRPVKEAYGTKKKDILGKTVYEEYQYVPKTREEIEAEYDRNLKMAMTSTDIDFTSKSPVGLVYSDSIRERLSLDWKWPSGERPTTQQWSIIEAHEKGHVVRPFILYNPQFFRKYFSTAFDPTVIGLPSKVAGDVFSHTEIDSLKSDKPTDLNAELEMFNYCLYLFSGEEVAERMSQLKNYFGFKKDEEFTTEHLRYAKDHYIKDTGMHNEMANFFKAITSETEAEFIRLINNSGI